jgi:hypothetical protein
MVIVSTLYCVVLVLLSHNKKDSCSFSVGIFNVQDVTALLFVDTVIAFHHYQSPLPNSVFVHE